MLVGHPLALRLRESLGESEPNIAVVVDDVLGRPQSSLRYHVRRKGTELAYGSVEEHAGHVTLSVAILDRRILYDIIRGVKAYVQDRNDERSDEERYDDIYLRAISDPSYPTDTVLSKLARTGSLRTQDEKYIVRVNLLRG